MQAVAEQGIVLEGTTEWTHTFGEVTDDDCVVPGTPSSSIDAACGKATLTFTNTIGQLDEDALFYLRSRGIESVAAQALLMRAFATEITGRISIAPLRERIDELLLARLARARAEAA